MSGGGGAVLGLALRAWVWLETAVPWPAGRAVEDVPGSTALNNLNRDGAQEGRGPGAANL